MKAAPEMAEFYVTFEWNELRYVAVVTAPEVPAKLDFGSYQELREAMEGLGHLWEMTFEMPHPDQFAFEDTEVWEKQLALAIEQIPIEPIHVGVGACSSETPGGYSPLLLVAAHDGCAERRRTPCACYETKRYHYQSTHPPKPAPF
jgi:hypothetical protein